MIPVAIGIVMRSIVTELADSAIADAIFSNIDQFAEIGIQPETKGLDELRGKVAKSIAQLPHEVAQSMLPHFRSRVTSHIDRPRPETVDAIYAERTGDYSRIGIRDSHRGLFNRLVFGGTETTDGVFVIPVNLPLDQYGNIRGFRTGYLDRLLTDPDVFRVPINQIGTDGRSLHHLPPGIYRKQPEGLRMLAAFVQRRTYRPLVPWEAEADAVISDRLSSAAQSLARLI